MSETSHVVSESSRPAPAAPAVSNSKFSTSNYGSGIGAATGGPMLPGPDKVSINGSTDLSKCIKGYNDSYIEWIAIEDYRGVVYKNKIRVKGRGPSGFGQRVHMTFYMQYGEQVTLSIASTSVEEHTVKCRTEGLVMITWDFE